MTETTATFHFSPGDWIIVTAYGLHYPGRVQMCTLRPNDRFIYEVEYAADGKIERREFAADELKLDPTGAQT